MTETSRKRLSGENFEWNIVLYSKWFVSDDDSGAIGDLPIQEATATEKSENEDSDSGQDSSGLHGVASVTNICMGIYV